MGGRDYLDLDRTPDAVAATTAAAARNAVALARTLRERLHPPYR